MRSASQKHPLIPRVGFGFDSHLFSAAGTLKLGGLSMKGCPALHGHSDGDALLHAVIDALLGAAGLGDIGELFSDRSARWRGADSRIFLRHVLRLLKKNHLSPVHVDVTVLANQPRLSPFKQKIRQQLARDMGLSLGNVNVKAKTQEGLTWFEKPGGLAVWAVATLLPVE